MGTLFLDLLGGNDHYVQSPKLYRNRKKLMAECGEKKAHRSSMSFDLTARAAYLDSLCEISVNGYVTRKMDFLGTVTICGRHYFNVFRRYNNVYEIVIEDLNGDYHFHKDYTVRQSLQRILCLSDEQMQDIHIHNVTSFKHNSCPLTMNDAPNMRWTEIQAQWQAAAMEFRGILEEYHALEIVGTKIELPELESPELQSPELQSPELQSPEPHTIQQPSAPLQKKQSAHVGLPKGTNLSDRFRAVEDKKRTWTQLSESESEYEESDEEYEEEQESDEEYEEEQESDEEEEESDDEGSLFCMRLRSGTTINK
jgi:hypothetical protein